MLIAQMQSLSILLIIDEFMEHIQITESSLDSSLWSSYSDWKEKIRSLPFEEVDAFREKMIKAIREAEKNRDDVPGNDEITITKNNSVKRVEDLLKSREIEAEELEPANRNYKEVIFNAGNTSEEIFDIEERIKDDIILKELKKRKNDEEEFQQEEVIIDGVKYNYNNSQIPSLYLIGFIGLLIVVGIGFLIYKDNARKRRIY
ncbi:hypothetical protein [endosymbiont GvMRE of Glomus versiforme]|uniref:hypothetical protein n=1 Tax=endosymbiont GvMRE of Glomus versiforme TaxID=2039283 RepID=UPI000EEB825F|nr:hypothetical protein [endosymbiont GvMRE of Glomus versiforme]RHZ35419.1 hypothetical protein GvMRE_IIg378 [endosymbiont GvMRE of Glomus versiforme]